MAEGDLGSNRYYYTQDEQGSTVYITDKEQRIKNEYCYDAFGNVLDSREDVHNRITYTGQQFDGIIGQYYLRARFYNPIIGRFTQEDVYRGDGLNLYAYCGSNPVGYFDPSGYDRKKRTPKNNVVSVEIRPDGSKVYTLKYRPKYNKDPNETFDITFDKDETPLFSKHPEHLYNNGGDGSKIVLPNGFNGRDKDKRDAKKIYNEKYGKEIPSKYELEHSNDLETLYVVKEEVHGSVGHTGGNAKAQDLKKEQQNNVTQCKNKGRGHK
ncbi:RHS repeat-associated core domain-containing protein [Clostridium estertheticum]|uniref:RHS repeat-associated core domain-containing protein n=1 Tax=Clostridium estertheticum TaxID=238834 RepID=UPI002961E88F|nr:RHS repeat-associated core domain-containing protein [Clostridium estertheticum]